jgi:hypothetical protein
MTTKKPHSGGDAAWLEIRLFPWRPRKRDIDIDALDAAPDVLDGVAGVDDLGMGCLVGVGIVLLTVILPVVLVGIVFALEWPVVLLLGLLLIVGRFLGVIPWTVVTVERIDTPERSTTAVERQTKTRSLRRAVRQIREANETSRTPIHWSWW